MAMNERRKPDWRVIALVAEQKYLTARTLIRWLGAALICYLCMDILSTFAGRTTEIMVSVLGKLEIAASLALAGGCAVWAILERIVRKRTIKRLTERTQKLEKAIDPRRSSSGLTPTGSTHPRDKDK